MADHKLAMATADKWIKTGAPELFAPSNTTALNLALAYKEKSLSLETSNRHFRVIVNLIKERDRRIEGLEIMLRRAIKDLEDDKNGEKNQELVKRLRQVLRAGCRLDGKVLTRD